MNLRMCKTHTIDLLMLLTCEPPGHVHTWTLMMKLVIDLCCHPRHVCQMLTKWLAGWLMCRTLAASLAPGPSRWRTLPVLLHQHLYKLVCTCFAYTCTAHTKSTAHVKDLLSISPQETNGQRHTYMRSWPCLFGSFSPSSIWTEQ